MRKHTVPAWLVNLLVRNQPKEMTGFAAAKRLAAAAAELSRLRDEVERGQAAHTSEQEAAGLAADRYSQATTLADETRSRVRDLQRRLDRL